MDESHPVTEEDVICSQSSKGRFTVPFFFLLEKAFKKKPLKKTFGPEAREWLALDLEYIGILLCSVLFLEGCYKCIQNTVVSFIAMPFL